MRYMRIGGLVLIVLTALAAQSQADMLDLTTAGSSGTVNDALFSTIDRSPTGTGLIDPFLRVQHNGTEAGYNSDAPDLLYDAKKGIWTHSVQVGDIRTIPIGGIDYKEFLLDIDEQGCSTGSLLSLDQLNIYLETDPDLSVEWEQLGSLGTTVYNLNSDGSWDNWIKLQYRLNPGSGGGDMYAYIPASLFTGAGPYVYLYSAFGYHCASGAGFEEWATDPPAGPAVPLPGAVLLGLLGVGAAGLKLRKFA